MTCVDMFVQDLNMYRKVILPRWIIKLKQTSKRVVYNNNVIIFTFKSQHQIRNTHLPRSKVSFYYNKVILQQSITTAVYFLTALDKVKAVAKEKPVILDCCNRELDYSVVSTGVPSRVGISNSFKHPNTLSPSTYN